MATAFRLIVLAATVLSGLCKAGERGESKEKEIDSKLHYSDCHIHALNFLQQGEFLNTDKVFPASEWGEIKHQRYLTPPMGQRWRRIAGILRAMDRGHIGNAVIFGMPVFKKWADNETYERPDGYLDNESHVVLARDTDLIIANAIADYQSHFADAQEQLNELNRLAPFVCGFDPTDLGSVDLLIERIKEFPGVWQGIGEIFARHDDVTHLSLGERPRANHPALLRVCKFAGQAFLPVSIHQNIAPVSRPRVIRDPVYVDELVELFRYCHEEPGSGRESTVFIWCHAGISRRVHVENLPYWIDEILDVYGDHVYIDLSWVVWDNYMRDDAQTWVELVEKYPERFLLGSDVVGGASRAGEELRNYDQWLDMLKPATRELVARDNLKNLLVRMADRRRLAGFSAASSSERNSGKRDSTKEAISLGSQGIVLPIDYTYPEHADMPRLSDEESFVRSRLKHVKVSE